ncbi:MAG TPA: phosphonate ABC transporter, permease protein PhnE [Bacilli bacterium]|nr:MAG: Phosphate-import permease protein PhnE [Tenericutes bacterium ADurb.BinA124]HNZ50381.1 phosphonate ABC transporter, permease protein PhnE [Bacilli bacterium]HOH17993.1 phosphonate ABC transporter, permease protein PhnE [Bacilli bacterium]HPN60881.1 phosphonate ABC transporter, permease protein PhnE [Bacilli bacterium]HQC74596.1 phosphonate ABC transporter, permease protein PhnE [Bacilli bacterium]
MNLKQPEAIVLKRPSQLKKYVTIALVIIILWGSARFANFSLIDIIENFHQAGRLLKQMFGKPAWNYAPKVIPPLLETIQMAIVSSLLGAIVAFPLALLASSNFTENKVINQITRFILNIFRTIPSMVLASLFVAIFGSGNFAGVAALFIFSFGLISKLLYESIEAIDQGQVEAIVSLGGNKLTVLRYGIVPQILPQFISYTLYTFEVNVRAAAVLGYVGAGGIGQFYERAYAFRYFDRVGIIVIITFVTVLIIDFISSQIRKGLV